MAQQFTVQVNFNSKGAIRSIKKTTGQLQKLEKRTSSLQSSISRVAAGFASAFLAFRGVGALTNAADSVQNIRNRLLALGESTGGVEIALTKLNNVANETRTSFEATANLYTRLMLASSELGRTQDELLGFTKSLNQAVVLSGASAQEAEAAIIQLSQGLASGTLRGDELRSVLEQLPKVADVIAKGLDATRGDLKRLGEEGKISAEAVISAFEVASDQLENEFGKTVPTLGQSMTVLANEFIELADLALNQTGIIKNLGEGFKFLAESIDNAIDGYDVLMGRSTRQVDQIRQEEQAFAGIGMQINKLNKQIAELEKREFLGEAGRRYLSQLKGQLGALRAEAQATNKAIEAPPEMDQSERAAAAKRNALFQQVYAKALADAKGPQEKFAEQQRAINKLLAEGKITTGEANALIERYSETVQRLERGAVSAFGRRLEQLREENNARRVSITFGEIEEKVFRRRAQLQREGKQMTEEQEQALRKELEVRRDLINLQERRAQEQEVAERRLELQREATALMERQGNAALGLKTALDQFALQADNVNKAVQDIANSFANNLTNTITEFVTTGKASFKEFASAIIADIARIITKMLVMRAISGIGGSLGLGGSPADGAIDGLAGARASGGPVNANKRYLVGENGPEMFVPSENGTIRNGKQMQGNAQPAPPPVTNLQVVNVQDPAMIPQAITDGGADDAIVNVINRNADAVRQLLQ